MGFDRFLCQASPCGSWVVFLMFWCCLCGWDVDGSVTKSWSGRVSKLVLTSSFLSVECPSAMKGGRGTSFESCGNRVK